MPLRSSHRAPSLRIVGGASATDGLSAPSGVPALTVLVASDVREKTRLLQALAQGRTLDDLYGPGRPGAAGHPTSARVNGHGGTNGASHPARPSADALLAARLRLAAVRAEAAQLVAEADDTLPVDPKRALQLVREAPEYRTRLLELAATRAQLATIEQTIAAREHQLAAFGMAPDGSSENLNAPAEDLSEWQECVVRARAAEAAMVLSGAEASARASRLGARANEELAREAEDEASEDDVRWRRLWRLRRDLEEIWEVQSRAEEEARALVEREALLRAADSHARWLPSRRLLRFSGAAALAGVLITFWSRIYFGRGPDAGDAAIAVALVLAHLWLRLWNRFAGRRAEREDEARQRQRVVHADMRRRRDRDWSRAAQLTTAIEVGAEALGLPLPVTPDVMDASEHAMADHLRGSGGETPLTALLVELLGAQELSERAEKQPGGGRG